MKLTLGLIAVTLLHVSQAQMVTVQGCLGVEWACSDRSSDTPQFFIEDIRTPRRYLDLGGTSYKEFLDRVGNWCIVSGIDHGSALQMKELQDAPQSMWPIGFEPTGRFRPKDSFSVLRDPQLGAKPFITILVKFADRPSEAAPRSYYAGLVGNSWPGLGNYYNEASYGLIDLTSNGVVGWLTLPHGYSYYLDGTGNQVGPLQDDAIALADPYVDFRNYYGINVCINDSLGGNLWGYGGSGTYTLDGVTRSWGVTTDGAPQHQYLLVHEMGHALRIGHAGDQYGNPYGSVYDPMGSGEMPDPTSYGWTANHHQAFHKWWMYWLSDQQMYVPVLGSLQRVRIERRALPASQTQKFFVKVPIGGSTTHYYTFEAFKRTGYDGGAGVSGIIVSDVDENRVANNIQVVDCNHNHDLLDPGSILRVGDTFQDLNQGVKVTVVSEDTSGYNVDVAYNTGVDSLTISPGAINNGQSATGTVKLGAYAPTSGAAVAITSSSPLAVVPTSITIPSGGILGNFPISTRAVAASLTVNIQASYNGVSRTAQLTISPTATLQAVSTTPLVIQSGGSGQVRVDLTAVAVTGGLAAQLVSSTPYLLVPSTVLVQAGTMAATGTITAGQPPSTMIATITAILGSTVRSASLSIVRVPKITSLVLSRYTIIGGWSITGTISLDIVAPTGGQSVAVTDNSLAINTPASVTVPAGSTVKSFVIATAQVPTTQQGSITVTANGTSKTANLTLTPPVYLNWFTISPSTLKGGNPATGQVWLNAVAGTGGAYVNIADNLASVVTPATVFIPAGATTRTFQIITPRVGQTYVCTVTASYVGVVKTATLTMTP